MACSIRYSVWHIRNTMKYLIAFIRGGCQTTPLSLRSREAVEGKGREVGDGRAALFQLRFDGQKAGRVNRGPVDEEKIVGVCFGEVGPLVKGQNVFDTFFLISIEISDIPILRISKCFVNCFSYSGVLSLDFFSELQPIFVMVCVISQP